MTKSNHTGWKFDGGNNCGITLTEATDLTFILDRVDNGYPVISVYYGTYTVTFDANFNNSVKLILCNQSALLTTSNPKISFLKYLSHLPLEK